MGFEKKERLHKTKSNTSRLFVCGISLTSGKLVSELFPDCNTFRVALNGPHVPVLQILRSFVES